MSFHIHVDISEAASKLNQTADLISTQITTAMSTLATQARLEVLKIGQEELSGYKRASFFGKEGKNVNLTQIGAGMWVLELDESAKWIEEGRDRVFMDWLLKNAKTAKDGSKYKVIPMSQAKGAGSDGWNPNSPALATVTKRMLDAQNIDLNKIERDTSGKPLVGILHKIPVGREEIMAEMQPKRGDYFSMPRPFSMAQKFNLPQHAGIFKLKGLVVVQRPNADAKHGVTREAITFRVISSKHQQEGRWFYPKVEALDSFPRVAEWAQKTMDAWMKDFEKSFADIQGS